MPLLYTKNVWLFSRKSHVYLVFTCINSNCSYKKPHLFHMLIILGCSDNFWGRSACVQRFAVMPLNSDLLLCE